MKIVGFTQLRNELRKGNLENWFKCMLPICDYIYIFDQNSDDGSIEYYKKFENVVVIESPTNRFRDEIICKDELLNKLKEEQPDADFIFWMDGDTLLDGRLLKDNGKPFKDLCTSLKNDDYDGYYLRHKNLWRSDIYWRNDNQYDWLNNGVCALWRFKSDITFGNQSGLHVSNKPINVRKIKMLEYYLIHRGFSTDYQIITKYNVYKSFGQKGNDLNRLLDESTLNVVKLDGGLLPDWFEITDDINPKNKKSILSIYNETSNDGTAVIKLK